MDIDGFNDSLGHAAGGEVLQVVGERLSKTIHDAGAVGRLGGDGFIVLLENYALDAGPEMVAERICQMIAQPARRRRSCRIVWSLRWNSTTRSNATSSSSSISLPSISTEQDDHRCGGPAVPAAPQPRRHIARYLHSPGRGNGTDRGDRSLGAAHRLRSGGDLAASETLTRVPSPIPVDALKTIAGSSPGIA